MGRAASRGSAKAVGSGELQMRLALSQEASGIVVPIRSVRTVHHNVPAGAIDARHTVQRDVTVGAEVFTRGFDRWLGQEIGHNRSRLFQNTR